MHDETIYKRNNKGKNVAKKLKTRNMKIKFKDRSININKIITIGRDDHNDIVIKNDPLVSRRHALIEKEGKSYYIMDNGSTNGTYLNNNPIPRCDRVKIKINDFITVGKTKLEII